MGLHTSSLREDDRQNVTEGRQSHEDRHHLFGARTEHVAEEGGGDSLARGQHLLLGDRGKVCDVTQHVHDADRDDGNGGSDLQGTSRVLGLAQGLQSNISNYRTPHQKQDNLRS